MQQDSPSPDAILSWLGYAFGALLSVFGGVKVVELARLYLERRKPAADVHLTGAQAERELASAETARVAGKRELFDMALEMAGRLEEKVNRCEAEVERMKVARDEALQHAGTAELKVEELERQMRALEGQLEGVAKYFRDRGEQFPH